MNNRQVVESNVREWVVGCRAKSGVKWMVNEHGSSG